MANLGCAGRTLIPIAIGCLVTAVVLAQTTKPTLSTVRLKPDTTYNVTADNVPQIPLPEQYVASGFSRTVDAVSGLGPTVPGHTVPDNSVPDNNVPQVLLSRHLMREAGVRVGDVVTLAAEADGSGSTLFRVAGVYEPTPDPRKFSAQRLEARLHLADLIALAEDAADPASGDVVSAINLALVDRKDADAVAAAIVRRVPGSRVASTQPSNSPNDPFAVLERFHWAIAIVTVTGSTAFLLALMVMRAEQRRDIIGILRLLGVPSRSILLEVLLEGLLIALGGAIFGIAMAVAAQGAINRFFQWRFDTTLVFVRVTAVIAWQAVAFAVPLGVAAGLAASWTLMRRSVVSLVGR